MTQGSELLQTFVEAGENKIREATAATRSPVVKTWIVVTLTEAGEPVEAFGPFATVDDCYSAAGSISTEPNDWMPVPLSIQHTPKVAARS